jgi:serine phosphatase RsbU (regulator of sigma subunit)
MLNVFPIAQISEATGAGATDNGCAAMQLEDCTVSMRLTPSYGAACGGDWCDAFALSEHIIAFSIGDVSGRGDEKHPTVVELRQAIRDALRSGADPARAIAQANRILSQTAQEQATAIVGILDVRESTLVFANAGHPAPVLGGAHGALFLEDDDADFPLGVYDDLEPKTHIVDIPAGSLVVFYTDGVTEREHMPLLGMAALLNATIFAYNFTALPTAEAIARQLMLTEVETDDAAILAAWLPRGRAA